MKCFSFSNGEKKEELTASKFKSTRSNSPETSGHNARRSTSQSVPLDMSSESLGRNALPSSFQKPNNLKVFTSSELKAATRNFNRSLLIGEGGFGCVYKAMISSSDNPHGRVEVAVKKLNRKGLQGHKEWVTEVNFLGVIEHPNLVKLVGYCAEDDERGIERFLVYELMPNRSVEDHLSIRSRTTLSWSMRLKIALDAAHGLTYLHEGMDYQVIFRDLKASNILLDEHWNAKLSDFGLARQGPAEGLTHVSTAAVGTVGYAAPEYVQTGRLTAKCDVWSYGVLLYVLITGRQPLDRNRPKHEQKLLEWVRPFILDTKKFHMILDPRLQRRYSLKSAWRLSALANKCLVRQAKSRPKMSQVFEMVKQIVAMESLKPQPQPQPQPRAQAQVQAHPQFQPQSQVTENSYGYPPPPWASATNNQYSPPPLSNPYSYQGAQTDTTGSYASRALQQYNSFGSRGNSFPVSQGSPSVARPLQHYNSFGSRTNNLPASVKEAQVNPTVGHGAPTMGNKPFVPSYRLFEDLIDLRSSGVKSNGLSQTSSLSGSAGQSMVGGRK